MGRKAQNGLNAETNGGGGALAEVAMNRDEFEA
jgi:hypothetical protein